MQVAHDEPASSQIGAHAPFEHTSLATQLSKPPDPYAHALPRPTGPAGAHPIAPLPLVSIHVHFWPLEQPV